MQFYRHQLLERLCRRSLGQELKNIELNPTSRWPGSFRSQGDNVYVVKMVVMLIIPSLVDNSFNLLLSSTLSRKAPFTEPSMISNDKRRTIFVSRDKLILAQHLMRY